MSLKILTSVFTGIILLVGGFYRLYSEDEDKPPSPAEVALEQLNKCADAFYTQEKAKVTRIACFVLAPEIFKSQAYRSRYILEKVDYEMIWDQDNPLSVKPRDIPPYFGWEAKAEAELYAKVMAAQLQEISKITNPVSEIIKQLTALQKTERYELKSSPDGKLHKIELTVKDTEKPKRRHRKTDRSKEEELPKEEKTPDNIILWLNTDYQITRLEIIGYREKTVGVLTPVKYNKLWNIGQLDVTTYKITRSEKEDSGESVPPPSFIFKDRTKVVFAYTNPVDKVMVISNLQITRMDSDGKALVRRNEPNPVNIAFTKHEVEKSK
ncbi:MAG: hypothetical protein HZA49_03765 [Planctomycetes bacterium]|nr:hypothetical protein [Planctomycetota bacterium]